MKNRFFYVLILTCCHLIVQPGQIANAQITLVGEEVQREQALPGEQYTGSVMIHNESDSALTVHIYQDEITALTSFDRGDKIVTINRSNADWVTHKAERMTIQSGEMAKVEYQVVVPLRLGSEAFAGTYWSSFSVDVLALGASEFRRPYSRHHLTDIATEIKDTGDAGLAINSVRLVGDGAKKTLQTMMINTGNLLVKPAVWIELYDTTGKLKERIPGTADWVFPGGFNLVTADVAHIKPGIYEVQVVVDVGDDQIFGASYTLDMTGIGTVAQSRMPRTQY